MIIVIIWRIYFFGMFIFMSNAVSSWAFQPSKKQFNAMWKALAFMPIWPLAVLSKQGRMVLLSKIKKL